MYNNYEDYPDLVFEGLMSDLNNNSYEILTEGFNFKEGIKKIWSRLGVMFKKIIEKVSGFAKKVKEAFIKLKNGMKTIAQKGFTKLIKFPFSQTIDFDLLLEYFEKAVPKALSAMPAIENYFDFFNKVCGKYAYNKNDDLEFPAVKLSMKQQEIFNTYFKDAIELSKKLVIDPEKTMTISYKEYVVFAKLIEIIVSNGFMNKLKECEQKCFSFLKWIEKTNFSSVNAIDAQTVINEQKKVASGFVTNYSVLLSNCNVYLNNSMHIIKSYNICLNALIPGFGIDIAGFNIHYNEKEEPVKKENKKQEEPNQNNTDEKEFSPKYQEDKPKYKGLGPVIDM